MPEEAWEALEVERLRRAIDDDSYRDDILRAKGIVSAPFTILSQPRIPVSSQPLHTGEIKERGQGSRFLSLLSAALLCMSARLKGGILSHMHTCEL